MVDSVNVGPLQVILTPPGAEQMEEGAREIADALWLASHPDEVGLHDADRRTEEWTTALGAAVGIVQSVVGLFGLAIKDMGAKPLSALEPGPALCSEERHGSTLGTNDEHPVHYCGLRTGHVKHAHRCACGVAWGPGAVEPGAIATAEPGDEEERIRQAVAEGSPLANLSGQWLLDLVDRLRANPADEHHTMAELYEQRMLYNAHAARGWEREGFQVVKSWKHSDGEPCFGGGWFIVVALLPSDDPEVGFRQVANHYSAEHWDLFDVAAAERSPIHYDGHTPADGLQRLREALTGQGEA